MMYNAQRMCSLLLLGVNTIIKVIRIKIHRENNEQQRKKRCKFDHLIRMADDTTINDYQKFASIHVIATKRIRCF